MDSSADLTRYLVWGAVIAIGALLAVLDWRWIRRPLLGLLLIAGVGGGLLTMRVSPFTFGGGDHYMQGLLVSAASALALVGYGLAAAGQFAHRYLRRRRSP